MKLIKLTLLTVSAAALLAALEGCSTGPKFDARAADAKFAAIGGQTVKADLDPALLLPTTNFFTVGPGDVLDLEILGNAASRSTVTVGPDGKIYFQFLSGLDVWGLTLGETKDLIEKQLSRYLSSAPQVTVSLRIVSSKQIWMLGRVARPGVYPITGPMTLLEAISMAGGSAKAGAQGMSEEEADLQHSFVQRNGQILTVNFQKLMLEGDMSQNIYLEPDDFIYLPSTTLNEIFVLGAVRSPRAVPFTQRLTLVSAVTAAAGPGDGAYLSHVAIVRGSLSEPKIAVVDYAAILSGKALDIPLAAHDIVYVPTKPLNGLKDYAKIILSTFVNTIAANEGANAVYAKPNKVGIAITPGQ